MDIDGKKLTAILSILGLAAVGFLGTHQAYKASPFELWKKQFGAKYDSIFEEAYRQRIFLENLAIIELHNSNKYRTYNMGINQFSAMTDEEFSQTYLGLNIPEGLIVNQSNSDDTFAADIDWMRQGAVTPVKNQGQCGSCWAFSTTGGLQGLSKVAYGTLQSFSEQQLVDCSGSYGNQACNGGLMDNAFNYVRDHGIVHEDQYPYKAVKQTCSQASGPFKISGFTDIKNCNDLAVAIAARPISVSVDASNWIRYQSGVFRNCQNYINHGVTLVGVIDSNWLIKNSWGTSWGESGYIRLAKGNTCGICNAASYPNK